MNVTVMNFDGEFPPDLVGDIVIEIQFNGSVLSVPTKNYISTHSIANMTLGYSFRCDEHFLDPTVLFGV